MNKQMDKYHTERFYALFIASAALTLAGIGLIISSFFLHAALLQYLGLGMLIISVGISIFANRAVKKDIDDKYDKVTRKVDAQFTNLRNRLEKKTSGQNTASTSDKQ